MNAAPAPDRSPDRSPDRWAHRWAGRPAGRVAGIAVLGLAAVAAVVLLARCVAPEAERQDPMALDCRELAIRMLEATDEADRRAAFRAFERKKCF